MCSANKLEVVLVIELFAYIFSKVKPCSSKTLRPAWLFKGIRPQQVTHGSIYWNLLDSVEISYMVQFVYRRRKSSMQSKNAVIDQSSQRKAIEGVREVSPNIRVSVFPQTLVVESVHLSDLSCFVISSKDGYSLGIPDFKRKQKRYRLHRVISSVNVVPHEKKVHKRRLTYYREKFHQIVKLSMNVSTNSYRSLNRLYVLFFGKNFLILSHKSLTCLSESISHL